MEGLSFLEQDKTPRQPQQGFHGLPQVVKEKQFQLGEGTEASPKNRGAPDGRDCTDVVTTIVGRHHYKCIHDADMSSADKCEGWRAGVWCLVILNALLGLCLGSRSL